MEGLGRTFWDVAGAYQRNHRLDQGFRKLGPAEPLPHGTLVGFKQLWLSRQAEHRDEQRDVVLSFRGEQVVRVRAVCHALNNQASFFPDLACSASFDGLTKLQVTARQSPSAGPVRARSFAEKRKLSTQNDDSDADEWGRWLHCVSCAP
jgi:hypothetical protein